jgi:hypothetical protein
METSAVGVGFGSRLPPNREAERLEHGRGIVLTLAIAHHKPSSQYVPTHQSSPPPLPVPNARSPEPYPLLPVLGATRIGSSGASAVAGRRSG